MWQKMLQSGGSGGSEITPIVQVPFSRTRPYMITEVGEYLVFYFVMNLTPYNVIISDDSSGITITELDRKTGDQGTSALGIVTYKIVTTSANRTIYTASTSSAQGIAIIKVN